jgi:transcriptional regulator with XRE-family HTH domain
VATAIDTGIPPRRLGRALRHARRALGLRRSTAAARLGVSPRLLVAWERGTLRVADDMAATLSTFYGEHLTARVPERVPVSVDLGRIAVGSSSKVLASTAHDDVLAAYVELLRAVRAAKPGAPVALRTTDLEVLAATIGSDVDDVETRIVELLRCTTSEARTLHEELRRRMLLVPMAGLALGAAVLTGAVADAPRHTASPTKVAAHAPSHTAPVAHATTTPLSEAPAPDTTATTSVPVTVTPPATAAPVTATTVPTPPPTRPSVTTPPTTTAPAPVTAASAPEVDDPPVAIPEGETPTIVQP